jgi:hypothetical protein
LREEPHNSLLQLLHFPGSLWDAGRVKWHAFNESEVDMLKKILLALGAAAATLGVSSAVLAHDRDHDSGRGWGWGHEKHHKHYYAPRPVVVVPAPPVVYAPPPRVAYPYYAAPVYAAPVYHAAPVYSEPSLSIRFDIPL